MINILINVNVNKIYQLEFTHEHIIYSKYTVAKTSESENKETQRKKVFLFFFFCFFFFFLFFYFYFCSEFCHTLK